MDRTFGRLGFYQIVRPLPWASFTPCRIAAVALLVLTTIRVPRGRYIF